VRKNSKIEHRDVIQYESEEQAIEEFYKLFGIEAREAKNIYIDNNLQGKVPDPCAAHKKIVDNRDSAIYSQEGLSYEALGAKIQKTIQISIDGDFKIPAILHHVWLSKASYSSDSRQIKFRLHNKFFQSNVKITSNWTHYLWTNDLSYIPNEVIKWCANHKVAIYDMTTIAASDNHFAQNHQFSTLAAKVKKLSEQQEFGLATDIARYLAIYLHGGVYVDGDYKISNTASLEKMMKSYNSFFGVERGYDVRVGNAFIAAEKESPIIAKVITLVERNILDQASAPDYVNYPNLHTQTTLVKTGPVALSVAFNSEARQDQDILLPYGYIYAMPGDRTKKNQPCKKWAKDNDICNEISVIGDHLFAQTWVLKKSDTDFDC